MQATDRADVAALTALLREEALLTMPPFPTWFLGREEIATAFALAIDPNLPTYQGQFRTVATAANRQPALAAYVRRQGESEYRALQLKYEWRMRKNLSILSSFTWSRATARTSE